MNELKFRTFRGHPINQRFEKKNNKMMKIQQGSKSNKKLSILFYIGIYVWVAITAAMVLIPCFVMLKTVMLLLGSTNDVQGVEVAAVAGSNDSKPQEDVGKTIQTDIDSEKAKDENVQTSSLIFTLIKAFVESIVLTIIIAFVYFINGMNRFAFFTSRKSVFSIIGLMVNILSSPPKIFICFLHGLLSSLVLFIFTKTLSRGLIKGISYHSGYFTVDVNGFDVLLVLSFLNGTLFCLYYFFNQMNCPDMEVDIQNMVLANKSLGTAGTNQSSRKRERREMKLKYYLPKLIKDAIMITGLNIGLFFVLRYGLGILSYITINFTSVVCGLVVSMIQNILLLLSEKIFNIFITENRSLSESQLDDPIALLPGGRDKATGAVIRSLLDNLKLSDRSTIEEALNSLPITWPPVTSLTNPIPCPSSSLMEYASIASGNARTCDDARKNNVEWWISCHKQQDDECRSKELSLNPSSEMKSFWKGLSSLYEARYAAVLQAVYSIDAMEQGKAFKDRKSLPGKDHLLRVRSFIELKEVSKLYDPKKNTELLVPSETGKAIKNNDFQWIDLLSSLTAVIDSLSISVQVASKMHAIHPTPPRSEKTTALMLGPSPKKIASLTKDQKIAYEWEAEMAAHKYRTRQWITYGWWYSQLLCEFYEYDPLNAYRLEKEKIHNPNATVLRDSLSKSIPWTIRTPSEQTDAIFADYVVIICAIDSIKILFEKSYEGNQPHQIVIHSVPMTLICLSNCFRSINEYEKSAVFGNSYGSGGSMMHLRYVVKLVKKSLRDSITSIVNSSREQLKFFEFPPEISKTVFEVSLKS